jgi:hypothetical protein
MILDTLVLVDIDEGKKGKDRKTRGRRPTPASSVTKTELYTGAYLREKTGVKALRKLLQRSTK